MGRKANIINSLKTMGYSIGEDDGGGIDVPVVSVGFRTNSGKMFVVTLYPYDFEKDFIVEAVVSNFNKMIAKDC